MRVTRPGWNRRWSTAQRTRGWVLVLVRVCCCVSARACATTKIGVACDCGARVCGWTTCMTPPPRTHTHVNVCTLTHLSHIRILAPPSPPDPSPPLPPPPPSGAGAAATTSQRAVRGRATSKNKVQMLVRSARRACTRCPCTFMRMPPFSPPLLPPFPPSPLPPPFFTTSAPLLLPFFRLSGSG